MDKRRISDFLVIFISILISFGLGYIIGLKNKPVTHPVEEIVKADSLIKVNDSIKIVINDLDSIKDAKIIEVQKLDKDSSVSLFYKLINK